MRQNSNKDSKTLIGITGGIATGKSTVSKILKAEGYEVIDADTIARRSLDIGTSPYEKIVEYFGDEILNSDKSIDRKSLGMKIFKNDIDREMLNSITHPYIINQIKEEIESSKEETLFLDIPLLIEIYDELLNSGINISEIWLVYCDRETQIKRLMKRDNIDYSLADSKINAQMDIKEKRKLSDKIIYNTDDIEELSKNVRIALKEIS